MRLSLLHHIQSCQWLPTVEHNHWQYSTSAPCPYSHSRKDIRGNNLIINKILPNTVLLPLPNSHAYDVIYFFWMQVVPSGPLWMWRVCVRGSGAVWAGLWSGNVTELDQIKMNKFLHLIKVTPQDYDDILTCLRSSVCACATRQRIGGALCISAERVHVNVDSHAHMKSCMYSYGVHVWLCVTWLKSESARLCRWCEAENYHPVKQPAKKIAHQKIC